MKTQLKNTYLPKIALMSVLLGGGTLCSSAWAAGSLVGLSNWSASDRLDTTAALQVTGYQLFGRYENGAYNILLKSVSPSAGIAPTALSTNTTIWLNTDGLSTTGYKIWGWAGGEEISLNIASDGTLNWYKYPVINGVATETLIGALPVSAYKTGGDATNGYTLEVRLTDADLAIAGLATPSTSGIKLYLDVNNSVFLPSAYANGEYNLAKLPAAVKNGKRIGIVYSASSANKFWALKAYSQLFMMAQIQAMQAGVPFDLLSEDDLKDLTKVIKYDTLVFPYFANVKAADVTTIAQNLLLANQNYKVGLVVAGNFMTNDENGNALSGDSYIRMKDLLGITRTGGTTSAMSASVRISNATHPLLQNGYTANEEVLNYSATNSDYFASAGITGNTVTPVVSQTLGGVSTQNAVLAIDRTSGARNVHFATVQYMGDANLLWSALQWSVYGTKAPIALQLGREKSLFAARNDMDESMYSEEYNTVESPLYTLINGWKSSYNFVGSYYLNIGNGTDNWLTSTNYTNYLNLYKNYLALGSEIGTHSYSHPVDTNVLTAAQIQTEFATSRTELETRLALSNLGGAVPGAPDNLPAATEMLKYVTYLSGGFSGFSFIPSSSTPYTFTRTAAGFTNAMGYLTPTDTKVYLSPNMTFDFTNIEFLKYTIAQTEAIWQKEFTTLNSHANQAVIHWPWHDYAPTVGTATNYGGTRSDGSSINYTSGMFTNLISYAYNQGTEFITGADLSKRINAFRSSALTFTQPNTSTIQATLTSADAGRYALQTSSPIASVTNWYAYNTQKVFPAKNGGTYTINLGATPTAINHITKLPMRANLLSTASTGSNNLSFSFEGQGKVEVALRCNTGSRTITGTANSFSFNSATKVLTLNFSTLRPYGTLTTPHTATITTSCP